MNRHATDTLALHRKVDRTEADDPLVPLMDGQGDPHKNTPEIVQSDPDVRRDVRADTPNQPFQPNGHEAAVTPNRGRFEDGNQQALKSGLYAAVKMLPDEICEWRDSLVAAQGGAEHVASEPLRAGYIRRLAVIEYQLRRFEQRVTTNRSERLADRTFAQYDALLSKWDKLASRLGMARRQRKVATSLDYLDGRNRD